LQFPGNTGSVDSVFWAFLHPSPIAAGSDKRFPQLNVPVAQQDGISSPGQGALPISQQRLWVLERLHPRHPAHNVACAFRLRGQLDAEKLGLAWREVIQPYEILRTEFHAVEGAPQPVGVPPFSPQMSVVDLEGVSPEEREARLSQLAQEETQRPFDLSSVPLLRASLWRVASLEHMFLLVAHRIVCDEASLQVLVRQLVLRYGTGQSGETRAAAPTQYNAYVSRQAQVSEGQISYWKQQLAGAPSSLDLPLDRPRPPEQTFHGASQAFSIGKPLLEQLRSLGQGHGATLFMTLLAAFNVLLSRYSRQDDLVVGTAISGRGDPKLANLVGPIENMVALRTDLSGGPTFSKLLTRIRDTTEEAFSHQDVPFELLLEQLPLERDLSRNPVFQVAFNQQVASESILAAGLHWEPVRFAPETEALDLTVNVVECDGQVEARFSYSADLFEHSTIARMIAHFQTLLQSAVENPERAISLLPILTPAERHQILVEWNDTRVDHPRDVPLHQFIEEQVEKTPESVALIYESERLTYRQLNNRANQLAHHLKKLGVGPDVLVAVCMERSLELVTALLAILKAGGAYVPLDPEYPKERLETMLRDAAAPVVVTQAHLLDRVPNGALHVLCLNRDWPLVTPESPDNLPAAVGGKNLAYAIYTSGSTGKPKGVPNVHEGIVNRLLWMQDMYKLTSQDRVLQKTPFSFDVSVWEFFWPLMTGATLVIARPGGHRDPAYLVDLIAQQGITTLHFVPSMLSIFLEAAGLERCRTLRQVFASGEALPFELQERFFAKLGAELHNLYGPTEAAVDVTYWACRPNSRQLIVPIGRPIANTQIYILDAELQPVPIGVAGELHIGGVGLAREYLNRPDLTAQKFIADPFSPQPGARLYKTGDLARFLADGNIEYLGRIDHQVKLRGFRIELGEIESALTQHPAVRQAAVVVREDIPGDKRLVAYLVSKGGDLDIRELRGYLARFLPEYMVPSGFSILPALPLTSSGKVDRKALPAPLPEHKYRSAVIAPRNQLETQLVSIFQKVLHTDSVSIQDDFFDLGGHSLTATRLLSQVKEITGRQIPLSVLFRGATVESLAKLIGEQGDASDPVVMEIQHGDSSRLPFFAIVPPGEESLGYAMLARHMGSAQTVYKIQGHAPVVDGKRPYSKQEMQDLTEEYVAAMRTVQLHGPYCLGGLCDGTHIAEQIVLSLEAQAEEVGLFAIFDTWVMQHSQIRWLWKVDYYRQRLRQMKWMTLAERLASYKRVAENKLDILRGKKTPRTDWQQVYWPEGFTPARFRAPVVLFKRPKQQFYYINDPEMGWGRRSKGGVEIHEIDFHHLEILREPHVRQFGETLAECVARVSRRTIKLEPSTQNQQASLTVSVQPVRQGS
jgi:amino acid adenylation domain-containing protein